MAKTEAEAKAARSTVRPPSPDEYRHQMAVAAIEEAATLALDEAPQGGRYRRADGVLVDANGRPVKDAE